MNPGLLIALPHGLNASGVTLWAVRLVNALASRGVRTGLILHPEPSDQSPCGVDLDERVGRFVLRGVPPLDAAAGDLSPYIPAYRDALRRLARDCAGPVALCPNLHGDCYGIAAALAQIDPEPIRIVAWQHTDQPYDLRLMTHYEPVISQFVAISSRIEAMLRSALPARNGDIARLPHGVPAQDECPTRPPLRGRPLRLVYTGRVEHAQKRIGALLELSDELTRRGIDHDLTIVGDGPAWAQIAAQVGARATDRGSERSVHSAPCATSPTVRSLNAIQPARSPVASGCRPEGVAIVARGGSAPLESGPIISLSSVSSYPTGVSEASSRIRLTGALSPDAVTSELDRADAFVLASRYEGLSVAMLEAMARGCVPIVTRVHSGASDAVVHGVNGLLIDAAPDADDSAVASLFADAIARLSPDGLHALSREAWRTARRRFSIQTHADGAEAILRAAATGPARSWPASRPCAFTAASGGSGSVPAHGAARLRAVLESLAGRTIVVHGVGRHTLQLAEVFAQSPARIAAFTDDDPRHYGSRLWNWPVVAPAAAAKTGATDVLISSWMHEDAIWSRRGAYERSGLRVHRIYGNHPASERPLTSAANPEQSFIDLPANAA